MLAHRFMYVYIYKVEKRNEKILTAVSLIDIHFHAGISHVRMRKRRKGILQYDLIQGLERLERTRRVILIFILKAST